MKISLLIVWYVSIATCNIQLTDVKSNDEHSYIMPQGDCPFSRSIWNEKTTEHENYYYENFGWNKCDSCNSETLSGTLKLIEMCSMEIYLIALIKLCQHIQLKWQWIIYFVDWR